MRIVDTLLVGALLLAGCQRKSSDEPPDVASASASTPAPGSGLPSEAKVVEVGDVQSLQALVDSSPSPIVRNNAKAALDSWNQKDYGSAVVYLKTVMTLPEAQLQSAEVAAVIGAMQAELQRAGQGGNRSAQQALQDLVPAGP